MGTLTKLHDDVYERNLRHSGAGEANYAIFCANPGKDQELHRGMASMGHGDYGTGHGNKTTQSITPRPHMPLLHIALAITLLAAGCGEETQRATAGDLPDDRGPNSVQRVAKTAQHAIHANAAEPIECEACHEMLGGEYLRAKSWQCEKCHASASLVLHAAASADSGARECWSCHDFTASEKRPTSCVTCHEEPQGQLPAIAPHDQKKPDEDCGACHRAHEKPTLVATECETCHDKEQVSGHDKPDIQITGCASCHGYHEVAATSSGRCTNCHRQSRAQVSLNATFDGGHEKCVTCHRQHRFFKTEVLGCRGECHESVVALSESKVKEHRGCLGCHDNHDVRASAKESCAECHKKKIVPKHPKDRDSGTACVGCHKPHKGAGAPIAVPCSDCHDNASSDKDLHQTAAQRGPVCKDCHKPHRFGLKNAGASLCLGCHGSRPFKNAKTVRPHAKHSDCVRCHGDKVAHEPAGPRAACGSCHKENAAKARKDHKKCVNCHDPHSTEQKKPCGSCHKENAAKARKDHKTCINCHEPHSTEQKKPCGGCHDAQAKAARKDHKKCVNCHEPHSTEQKKPCGSCHEEQARTAPSKHQQCLNCHDQHSTLVKKQCKDCHKDRASGIHAPVKGGCVNCHRPHGPNGQASPPACTTCHKQTLPSLHAVPDHKDCTKCHKSHGEQPYRQQAACLACHKDKTDHEPTATMCIGCHTFGGVQ